MKTLFSILFMGLISTQASAATYEEVLNLIKARNANQTCSENAFLPTIVERARQVIQEDPSKIAAFKKDIPADSDVLRNLEFRALLEDVELRKLIDTRTYRELLVNTVYYSQSQGPFGPGVMIELKADNIAEVTRFEIVASESELERKSRNLRATWRAETDLERFGDAYQFLQINVEGVTWRYRLEIGAGGGLNFVSETDMVALGQPPQLFFDPDECSI